MPAAAARSALPLLLLLGTAAAAAPAVAADADACGNEVQRLTSGFAWLQPDTAGGGEVKEQPGMRQGATIDDTTRRQLADLVEQARAAAGQGDSQGCLDRLGRVRAGLREAGFGAAQAGAPSDPGLAVGNGTSTGTAATTGVPDGGGATGAAAGSGAAGSTAGGGAAGSSTDAGSPAFSGQRPDNSGITNSPGTGSGLGVGGSGSSAGGLGGGGSTGGGGGSSSGGGSSGGGS